LLDKEGYLAYSGPAKRAYEYFSRFSITQAELKTPDHLLDVLEAVRKTPTGATIYEKRAGSRMPVRVKTPQQWSSDFKSRKKNYNPDTGKKFKPFLPHKQHIQFYHLFIRFVSLFLRNFKNKMRDRTALVISFALPAFLAVTLAGFLRISPLSKIYHWSANTELPKFLFLSAIIIIFLAISNTISEILKDRVILNKERLIGYSGFTYLFSKFITLILIGFYQTFIFTLLSFIVLGIPVVIVFNGVWHAGLFWHFFIFSYISFISVICLGLAVSTIISSEKVAFYVVPLLIIPQIIFGGLFLNFNDFKPEKSDMSPYVPTFCAVVHSRWMYEGYLNIFRYKNAGKVKAYRTIHFYRKYGNQLNSEIMDTFYNYNLSRARAEKLKEEQNNKIRKKMKRYLDSLNNYEEGKITWSVFARIFKETGKNYFLYYKKVFAGGVFATTTYNTIVISIMAVLFFALAVFRLEYVRKKGY